MKIKVTTAALLDDIQALDSKSDDPSFRYASLLRILLNPSLFEIEDSACTAIIQSLRRNEVNSTSRDLLELLNSKAPISIT